MIQIDGVTDIYFNSQNTFISDINYHFKRNFKQYQILEHQSHCDQHQMKIKFSLRMQEKYQCKTLLDYNSYAYDELKKRLPSKVKTTYIQTISINPVA
ncbi:hypothetical protein [Aquibacillus sediminis]|uniref:hypothetical protein n=1 Tax=Aquibacillus sediminis TaxID=2574734 RepID=UPI0011089298|nr:hypothetical protein [Aquibacillus sediminis]